MSPKQITANGRNAQKSTGPKTPAGRAVSKMNALKHGILSKQVLVRGSNIKESSRELQALHQRFWEELNPVGPVEEMLVDQIVTTHWRLRRALTAESGEIALSVDGGQWKRETSGFKLTALSWECEGDPVLRMRDSAFGNRFMEKQLEEVRASVGKEGELTEAAIQSVMFRGKPYGLTRDLDKLRLKLQENPEGLDAAALRDRNKQQALTSLDRKLRNISWSKAKCEEREENAENAKPGGGGVALPGSAGENHALRNETGAAVASRHGATRTLAAEAAGRSGATANERGGFVRGVNMKSAFLPNEPILKNQEAP